ncbi:MAG TPA: PKD domain-containing protein, partial [Planctomycetaceae bacterium]|nr:PKD domain-containing protein [Planctomycetaceae bacterium]
MPTDTMSGWTIVQHGGSPTGQGTGYLNSGALVLTEGDSFDVLAEHSVTVPENPGTLTFRYQNLSFDPSATNHEINDAFEASFVDANGSTLVPTFASGRDAFFNITHGQSAALGAGTTLDPASLRLSVDISGLPAGATGTLVLRLVNNDQTTKTSVEIIGDSEAPGITAGLLNDTAPAGATNVAYSSDGITTDPTITGTLTGTITQLQVQQDGAALQDITSAISGDQFLYLPPNLSPGPHQFVFQATDSEGGTSQATVNLTYDLGPNAIIAGSTQTTTGSSLTFDASASTTNVASIYSYGWQLPDGSTASAPSVPYTFATAGTFPVRLTVTDIAGATNTAMDNVQVADVLPAPTISGPTAIAPGSTYLLSLSTNSDATFPVSSWRINWGDGDVQNVSGNPSSVSHVYTTGPAQVTISATATNADGPFDSNSLDVQVTAPAPTVLISGALAVTAGSPYTLNLSSTEPNPSDISSWSINWGDGNIQTVQGNPSSVIHTYADPNTYPISASATDQNGTYDSNSLDVTVNPIPPTFTISGPATVNEDATYTLTLAANNPNQVPISSWTIHWGDGSPDETLSGNPTSVTHVFANANSYVILASANDYQGSVPAAAPVDVNVGVVPPTVTISGAATVNEDATYTLNLSATGEPSNHPITGWTINWGDGTDQETVPGNPSSWTHIYANKSPDGVPYAITASAIEDEGPFAAAAPVNVTVEVVPPTVTISGSPTVVEEATYTLNLSATGEPSNHPITSWSINWGDNTAPETVPNNPSSWTHVYADARDTPYTIMASAVEDEGTFPAAPLAVTVVVAAPTVTISGDSSVNEGATYTLNLSATGEPQDHPITGWTINWGDGTATESVSGNPSSWTHPYANKSPNGVPYIITASAIDDQGVFPAQAPVYVTVAVVPPTVTISGNQTVNEDATYTLNLSATGEPSNHPITGWTINWGDGTDTETVSGNPSSWTHTYLNASHDDIPYAITASAIEDEGTFPAEAPVDVTVAVVPPTVTISGDATVTEEATYTLNLSATGEPSNHPITSWTINWGDGTDSVTVPGNP